MFPYNPISLWFQRWWSHDEPYHLFIWDTGTVQYDANSSCVIQSSADLLFMYSNSTNWTVPVSNQSERQRHQIQEWKLSQRRGGPEYCIAQGQGRHGLNDSYKRHEMKELPSERRLWRDNERLDPNDEPLRRAAAVFLGSLIILEWVNTSPPEVWIATFPRHVCNMTFFGHCSDNVVEAPGPQELLPTGIMICFLCACISICLLLYFL